MGKELPKAPVGPTRSIAPRGTFREGQGTRALLLQQRICCRPCPGLFVSAGSEALFSLPVHGWYTPVGHPIPSDRGP